MQLTEAQITHLGEFSQELAAGLEAGQARRFEEALDFDHLIRRALQGVETPPDFQESFVERLRRNPASITAAIGGHSYEFLRVLDRDGVPMLVFRIRQAQGGVGYLAFLFSLDGDGSVKIYDFYSFLTGQSLSESTRRIAILALAQSNYSFVGRLLGRDRAWADNMHNIDMIGQLWKAQEYGEAIRFFDKLPPELQEMKTFRLLEIRALVMMGGVDQRYTHAVEGYREAFPDDPSLPLVSIEYHLKRGEYDAAMRNIDDIDAAVGGDPFLDSIRILAAARGGRGEEAVDRCRAYIAADPVDEERLWLLVNVGQINDNLEVMQEGLEGLEKRFGYAFTEEALSSEPLYAKFLQSERGREFLASRGTREE